MKITEWPAHTRPREKLIEQGPSALSDSELLAIFLRTGTAGKSAFELANSLLTEFGSLSALLATDKNTFCQNKGLGEAKFAQLQAVLELANRAYAEPLKKSHCFNNAEQTKRFVLSKLRQQPREVFAVLLLDAQHQLIRYEEVFKGTVNSAPVYPRELVKLALSNNAAAIILAHNHPSGVAEPSQADQFTTQKIVEAMALIEVRVLDHFIVGANNCVSFAQLGIM